MEALVDKDTVAYFREADYSKPMPSAVQFLYETCTPDALNAINEIVMKSIILTIDTNNKKPTLVEGSTESKPVEFVFDNSHSTTYLSGLKLSFAPIPLAEKPSDANVIAKLEKMNFFTEVLDATEYREWMRMYYPPGSVYVGVDVIMNRLVIPKFALENDSATSWKANKLQFKLRFSAVISGELEMEWKILGIL